MISNTLIPYGQYLTEPEAQAGWTVESDGFGLLQAQIKFKWDIQYRNDFTARFSRGRVISDFIDSPGSTYANMGLWKANMVVDKANILTITADFCGIDPYNPEGATKTQTQVVMTGSTSSEAIEHHPNFLKLNSPTAGLSKVLAGFPPERGGFVSDPAANPNRALWTPYVAGQGAEQGFQFVGFLPNQKESEYPDHINIKAGIKNYYKPSNTLRCLFYVNNETTAVAYASYVGWNSDGSLYNIPTAYKGLATGAYGGAFQYTSAFQALINRGFLITNCSVERFGNIFKVTADMMLSGISGWDKDIYPHIAGL